MRGSEVLWFSSLLVPVSASAEYWEGHLVGLRAGHHVLHWGEESVGGGTAAQATDLPGSVPIARQHQLASGQSWSCWPPCSPL